MGKVKRRLSPLGDRKRRPFVRKALNRRERAAEREALQGLSEEQRERNAAALAGIAAVLGGDA